MKAMKKKVLQAIVAITLACVAACGGKVVIDQDDQGTGAGGAGSSTASSSVNSSASTGIDCSWPEPIGDVSFCGGSVGSGPGSECSSVYCDVNKNAYQALCQGNSCQCRYNDQVMCTCALNGGDICSGDGAPCCPIPL